MEISWFQAALLGLFACLSSMPGLGGTSIGNYTLGRPFGWWFSLWYYLRRFKDRYSCWYRYAVSLYRISYSWWTVSADVRAVSYIGIPLAMIAIHSYGLNPASVKARGLATSFGTMVGTLGTVLFYGTATINLAWQHIGWTAVEKRRFQEIIYS